MGSERCLCALDRCAKDWLRGEQLAGHSDPLRPLPRENERNPASTARSGSGCLSCITVSLCETAQSFDDIGPAFGHEDGTVFERRAMKCSGGTNVLQGGRVERSN